jgi:phage-related minor tail protein
MAQDAVLIGFSKMNQAVDDFVKTGKFKFKDFALSAIADITSMLLKAQLFKGITAGLGLFGIKLPGLAMGGPAQAGQPYIVGEKGPELFVPKNAGTVIPNNKLGSQSAGAPMQPQQQVTNNYVTNNINAIDAKSVAQLFVENRKTLLGATVMARKEMPYGMA